MSDERTCPVPVDVLGRIQRCDRALLPGRDRCLEHDHPGWGERVVGRRAATTRQDEQTSGYATECLCGLYPPHTGTDHIFDPGLDKLRVVGRRAATEQETT